MVMGIGEAEAGAGVGETEAEAEAEVGVEAEAEVEAKVGGGIAAVANAEVSRSGAVVERVTTPLSRSQRQTKGLLSSKSTPPREHPCWWSRRQATRPLCHLLPSRLSASSALT